MTRSVYIIRSEPGHLKVGIAGRPRHRLSQLRTASAVPLHLDFVAETDGDVAALERRVHEILDAKRLSGEWFSTGVHGAIGAIIQAAQELDLDLRDCALPAAKKRRGRPKTTGTPRVVGVRVYDADLTALDAWIASQPEPKPTRSEAIRLALKDWLTGLGLLKGSDDPEMAN